MAWYARQEQIRYAARMTSPCVFYLMPAQVPVLAQLHGLRFFVLDEVDRMVEQGHFKELRNLMALLEHQHDEGDGAGGRADAAGGALSQRHANDVDASGLDADDDADEAGEEEVEDEVEDEDGVVADASGGGSSDGGGASKRGRQTFLFSATLMLPPAARESSAARLAKNKPLADAQKGSTMDSLLRQVVFRNSLKVVDLSRPALVPTQLEQTQLACAHEDKDAFLMLMLRTRLASGRTIVFTNAVSALQRLRSLLVLLRVPVLALMGGMQQRARLKALERFKGAPNGAYHHPYALRSDVQSAETCDGAEIARRYRTAYDWCG